jgi:plastocyanin
MVIVLLVAVAFAIEFFSQDPSGQQQAAYILPPQPPLTPERTVAAIGAAQFAVLVAYTDQGFEPASLSVDIGDTVRFVNNASMPLVLAVSAESGTHSLPPGEYVEITFNQAGVWSMSNADTAAAGSISVE